jgi:TnsA-like endonuclease N terminal/TnsA endonuclease C terminal
MAGRRVRQTQTLIARRIAEGRGQGTGKEYKPYLRTQDVPSRGRAHRIKGWKHGRVHPLLSDLELKVFLIYEWSSSVTEIREQFPLPLDQTQAIAEECGIVHPHDIRTKEPVVITLDFLLLIKVGLQILYQARTAKYSRDLCNGRTREKLEIERRYWQSIGVDWAIVTELEIPEDLILNLKWLHPFYHPSDLYPLTTSLINSLACELTDRVLKGDLALREVTKLCDFKFHLDSGWSLSVVRHLLARKYWITDIYYRIRPSEPLLLFECSRPPLYKRNK